MYPPMHHYSGTDSTHSHSFTDCWNARGVCVCAAIFMASMYTHRGTNVGCFISATLCMQVETGTVSVNNDVELGIRGDEALVKVRRRTSIPSHLWHRNGLLAQVCLTHFVWPLLMCHLCPDQGPALR